MRGLNLKQRKFVDEYVLCLNATKAAKNAGYSCKTAYSQGQRLLKNVEVQNHIREIMNLKKTDIVMSQDEILKRYTSIARDEKISVRYKLKALDSLAKCYGMFNHNLNINSKLEEVITVELPDELK